MITLLKRQNGHFFSCDCLTCEGLDLHQITAEQEERSRRPLKVQGPTIVSVGNGYCHAGCDCEGCPNGIHCPQWENDTAQEVAR